MKAPPVCILGMGRSGTSVASRMTGALGVWLGPDESMLGGVDGDNARGYWEQTPIIELNDRLLVAFGATSWYDARPLPADWAVDVTSDLVEEAGVCLERLFGGAGAWGWKDPRTSLTLPFWRALVPDAPRCVVCVRHPGEVARSLARRSRELHPPAASATVWGTYTRAALAHSADLPRIVLHYEDWFSNPEGQLRRLSALARPDLDEPPEAAWRALDRFVSEELRHHHASLPGLLDDDDVPLDVKVLYAALRLGAGREDEAEAVTAGLGLAERVAVAQAARSERDALAALDEERSRLEHRLVVRVADRLQRSPLGSPYRAVTARLRR